MKGQSLFEVIFALAVAALIMVGVVSLAASSIRNTTYSRNNSFATRYVQETSEWLREQRDMNWDYLTSNLGDSCLGDLNWGAGCQVPNTIFQRRVNLTLFGADKIEAKIRVSWDDAQGSHEVRSVTRYTNWIK